ncbi:MAG: hypothetical protein ABIG43_06980 [Chloroflexota bacterium]
MSNVFDRLQNKLDIEKRDEGISLIEIAQLPSNLRQVMRIMLRELEITRDDLITEISKLPEDGRLQNDELLYSLETLTKQNWLISCGEGKSMNYQVNLRRKSGSSLAKCFWAQLDDRIAAQKLTQQNNNSGNLSE